jgi:hypothetical protein
MTADIAKRLWPGGGWLFVVVPAGACSSTPAGDEGPAPAPDVWLAGNGAKDAQILKFTNGGQFLLQRGTHGVHAGCDSSASPFGGVLHRLHLHRNQVLGLRHQHRATSRTRQLFRRRK